MNELFHKFSVKAAKFMGSPWMFIAACLVVVIWILTGPIFQFSNTWQLVINTGTTVITFLMVFLIQNSQNREESAMQLKLDELIRAVNKARNNMVNLEELTDEELESLKNEFRKLQEQEQEKLKDPVNNEKKEKPK